MLIFTSSVKSQFEDYQWVLGYYSGLGPNTMIFNFASEELKVNTVHSSYKVELGNAIISEPNGQRIIAISNGFSVFNAQIDTMENGNRINVKDAFYSRYGLSLDQGILILNQPGSDQLYRIYYLWSDRPQPDSLNQTNRLYEATIDSKQENGLGRVVEFDRLIDTDRFEYGKIQACRHANGRDWWLLIPRRYTQQVLVYLLDPGGIKKHHTEQVEYPIKTGLGQAQFSPDGTQYAILQSQNNFREGDYLQVFDFDRCEGILSNMKSIHITDTAGTGGLTYSPNSKFIYLTTSRRLYQFNTDSSNLEHSRLIISNHGNLIDSSFSGFVCETGIMSLAPNGKIYIATTTGTLCMHVIEEPDSSGVSCKFIENGLPLPAPNTRSMPNFPHFRLGPVDGSVCDSLGIDNVPLARWNYKKNETQPQVLKFRDLSNYLPTQWHWDFGDPSSGSQNISNVQHPIHVFSQSGMYKVCLTVSNPNGEDRKCKDIEVILTDTEEKSITSKRIQINNNPAGNVIYFMSRFNEINNYLLKIFDLQGREIFQYSFQPVSGKQYVVEIPEQLSSGIYTLGVFDENGKMVQIEKMELH